VKIAIAQMNPVVGAVEENAREVAGLVRRARGAGARVVLFPELAVTGYPPRDLLERRALALRSGQAVRMLAPLCDGGLAAVVGFAEAGEGGGPLHNAAALLSGGKVAAVYRKSRLPVYDVFDETRYFAPGGEPLVFDADGVRLGVTICEDIWVGGGGGGPDPAARAVEEGARVVLNLSASPFTRGKGEARRALCAMLARRLGAGVVYCNQVGGNDDLVFDGGSFAVDASGAVAAAAPLFEEDLLVVEASPGGALAGPSAPPPASEEAAVWGALTLGVRDYVRKSGSAGAWIGLSGGIDSALVACLAAEALGPAAVQCVAMPSRFSADASLDDARLLAEALGVGLRTIPIEPVFAGLLETLAPHFGGRPFDVAEENLQSRVRGTLLMALSNKLGGLVLATGNKSELATGYCTLYGDMVGALAPIGDVFKTGVYALARHVNRGGGPIPRRTVERAPTAELRPDQTDQDALPPYADLDRLLALSMEEGRDVEEIVGEGFPRELVVRVLGMLRAAEHKRRQAAIVLKVSPRAFGPGRRYPLAQGYKEK